MTPLKKYLKLTGKATLLLLLSLVLLISAWIIWEHQRDPLKAINLGIDDLEITGSGEYDQDIISVKRHYFDYSLHSKKTGEITVYTSLPTELSDAGLPVMIILGGLHIGRSNFSFIQNPGNNILVIYSYPYSTEYWYEGTAVSEIPKIREAVIKVPAQVTELISWIQNQPWADKNRISVLGYSFGALFVPAVYRLAEYNEISLQAGILSYGGADIEKMLYTNLKKMSDPFRTITAFLAATAINVMEPGSHLPHTKNEFLIINGTKDHQIPAGSWKLLHEVTPEPKTIKILSEGHMHPDKPELTQKLVQISKNWLVDKGVVNP